MGAADEAIAAVVRRGRMGPGSAESAVAQVTAYGNALNLYSVQYARDAVSDWYLLDRLQELQAAGDVADARAAMAFFLEQGIAVSVWGDDRWAQTSMEVWQEEVERAVVDAGLWLDADTGEPVDPGRPVETVYLPGDQPS